MDSWSADYREGDSSLPLSGQPPSHSGPLTRDFSQSQAQTSSCPEGSSLSKVRVNMGGFGKGLWLIGAEGWGLYNLFPSPEPLDVSTSCPQPSQGQSGCPCSLKLRAGQSYASLFCTQPSRLVKPQCLGLRTHSSPGSISFQAA